MNLREFPWQTEVALWKKGKSFTGLCSSSYGPLFGVEKCHFRQRNLRSRKAIA